MIVKNIKLTNYRSYINTDFTFTKGLNIILGNNAVGKTNLVEAIYYCCIGKSFRTSKEKDVINFDKDNANIFISILKRFGNSNIEINFDKNKKKVVKINKIPIKRIGELMGELNVVFFSPNELKLIREAPEDRRKFLDIDISQVSKNYFYLLNRYEKILMYRNKLLKDTKDINVLKDNIFIWDEQLSNIGSKIILSRIKFINKLTPYAKLAHNYLTDNNESLELEYIGIKGEDTKVIKEKFLNELQKNIEKDFNLGYTTIGPHRDDLSVKINNIDVRNFGSQGQQRTAAISLKLAELEIFKDESGEMPILILDDVFSEIDDKRKNKLINFSKKTQTIITATEYPLKASKDINFIKISKN